MKFLKVQMFYKDIKNWTGLNDYLKYNNYITLCTPCVFYRKIYCTSCQKNIQTKKSFKKYNAAFALLQINAVSVNRGH